MITEAYKHGARNRLMGCSRKSAVEAYEYYPEDLQQAHTEDAERGWDDMDRYITLRDMYQEIQI